MRVETELRHHADLTVPNRKPGWTYYDYDLQAVAWAPHEPTVAIGGGSGRAFLLDPAGALLWESAPIYSRRPGATERSGVLYSFIERLAFSPDGDLLAAATFDHQLVLWRPAEGPKPVWQWAPQEGLTEHPLAGLTFSPDGVWVVVADHVGRLRGWRTETLEKSPAWSTPSAHSATVALCWPRGASSLVATHADGRIRRWQPGDEAPSLELDTGLKLRASAPGPLDGAFTVAADDGVYLVDWRSAERTRVLTIVAQSVAWTRGDVLAVKHSSAVTLHRRVRDTRLEPLCLLNTASGLRGELAFSSDGRWLAGALGTERGTVWRTGDLARGEALPEPPPPLLHPRAEALLDTLTLCSADGWRQNGSWRGIGERLWSTALDTPVTKRFAATPEGIFTALLRDLRGSITTRDPLEPERRRSLPFGESHSSNLPSIQSAAGGLLVATPQSLIRVKDDALLWSNALRSAPSGPQDVPVMRDGVVAVGYDLDRVMIFDADSGEQLWFWSGSIHKSSGFAIDAGHLVLGLSTSHIGAIALRDRRVAWSDSSPRRGRAFAARDGVACVATCWELFAVAVATGERLWRHDFDAWCDDPRLLFEGGALIVLRKGSARAIDPETGEDLWCLALDAEASPHVTLCDGRILLTDGQHLRVILAERGEEEARLTLPAALSAPPALCDGVLYIGTEDGQLHAFAPEHGAEPTAFSPDARRRAALVLGMRAAPLEDPTTLTRLLDDPEDGVSAAAERAILARLRRGAPDTEDLLQHLSASASADLLERATAPEMEAAAPQPELTPPPVLGRAPCPLPPHRRPDEFPGVDAPAGWRAPPALLWNAFADDASDLLLTPDSAIVATREPGARAFDLGTGEERWRTRLPGASFSTALHIASHGAQGLVVAWYGNLSRLDISTGRVLWSRIRPGREPLVGLYATREGGPCVTLSQGQGSTLTFYREDGEVIGALSLPERVTGLAHADGVWIAYNGTGVFALEPRTARELWRMDAHVHQQRGPLSCDQGRVFVGTEAGLVALDARRGDLLWRTALPEARRLDAAPAARDGVLYTSSYSYGRGPDHLYAVGAEEGAPLWHSRLQGGASLRATIAGEVVLVPTLGAHIVAFDRETGGQLWQLALPGNLCAPLQVRGGRCYALCQDRQLYVLSSDPLGPPT